MCSSQDHLELLVGLVLEGSDVHDDQHVPDKWKRKPESGEGWLSIEDCMDAGRSRPTEAQVLNVAVELLNVLEGMQQTSPPILHGRISPKTVLLKDGDWWGPARLADRAHNPSSETGLAQQDLAIGVPATSMQEKRGASGMKPAAAASAAASQLQQAWVPPEQALIPGGPAAPALPLPVLVPASDLLSLGAVLLFMLTGKPVTAFPRDVNGAVYWQDSTSVSCPTLATLLRGLLHPKPSTRFTPAEALQLVRDSADAAAPHVPTAGGISSLARKLLLLKMRLPNSHVRLVREGSNLDLHLGPLGWAYPLIWTWLIMSVLFGAGMVVFMVLTPGGAVLATLHVLVTSLYALLALAAIVQAFSCAHLHVNEVAYSYRTEFTRWSGPLLGRFLVTEGFSWELTRAFGGAAGTAGNVLLEGSETLRIGSGLPPLSAEVKDWIVKELNLHLHQLAASRQAAGSCSP